MNQLKESFQMVRFVGCLGQAIQKARADGKINLRDVAYLLPVIPTVMPAFADADEVVGELKNLSEDDATQLRELFFAEFNLLDSEASVDLFNAVLQTAGGLASLVHFFDNRNDLEP